MANLQVNPRLANDATSWPGDQLNTTGGARVALPALGGTVPAAATHAYSIVIPASGAYVDTPHSPVEAGKTYTISAYFGSSGAQALFSDIVWLDANGDFIDWGPDWETTNLAANTWDRRVLTDVAPAGTAFMAWRLTEGNASTTTTYITCVQIEEGTTATAYADPVVAKPKLSTLQTDFSAMPAFFTLNYGAVSVVDGEGHAPTQGYTGFETARTYSFEGDSVFVKLVQASGTGFSYQTQFVAKGAGAEKLEILNESGVIKGRTTPPAGAYSDVILSDPYDPATQQWWRIREDAGTVYYDTSPDAVNWTNRGSATHGGDYATAGMVLGAGHWNAADTDGVDAIFDNLNLAPVVEDPQPTTPPTAADALQQRTLDEFRDWQSWLTDNGATGFIGEWGIVTKWADYGDAAQHGLWEGIADVYLEEADVKNVHTAYWSSGREFDDGYPLGMHVGTTQDDPLTIEQSDVLAGHPSRWGLLRAVNLAGYENGVTINGGGTVRSADGFVHTNADFAFLAASGIDCVRLPVAWERIQPTLNAALDSTALTEIGGMIADAANNGISVIFDIHNYGRYTAADGTTVYTLGDAALDADELGDLWTRISTWVQADSTRNATVVAYGIMNEPWGLTGGTATWESVSQAVLTDIRTNGDTRLVFVSGDTFASLFEWRTWHPDGWITDPADNFAYEAHHYWDSGTVNFDGSPSPRSGQFQQPNGAGSHETMTYAYELNLAENPPVPEIHWAADLSQTDLSLMGYDNWQTQTDGGVFTNEDTLTPPVVSAPGSRPGDALQITIDNDTRRNEVVPNHRGLTEGDSFYFSQSFYLADGFPLDFNPGTGYDGFQIIDQIHQAWDSYSPPISFEITDSKLKLTGGSGLIYAEDPAAPDPQVYLYFQDIGPVETETWYDLVYYIENFSETPGASTATVWLNGIEVLTDFVIPPPTLVQGDAVGIESYRKHGIYHSNDMPGLTIYQAGMAAGTSYAEVDPDDGIVPPVEGSGSILSVSDGEGSGSTRRVGEGHSVALSATTGDGVELFGGAVTSHSSVEGSAAGATHYGRTDGNYAISSIYDIVSGVVPSLSSDGIKYVGGLEFEVDVPTEITHLRYYRVGPQQDPATEGAIYEVVSSSVGNWISGSTVLFPADPADSGWIDQALDSPVTLQPGIRYRVGVAFSASGWVYYDGVFNAGDVVSGPLRGIQRDRATSGVQDTWAVAGSGGQVTYPSQFSPGVSSSYAVDVISAPIVSDDNSTKSTAHEDNDQTTIRSNDSTPVASTSEAVGSETTVRSVDGENITSASTTGGGGIALQLGSAGIVRPIIGMAIRLIDENGNPGAFLPHWTEIAFTDQYNGTGTVTFNYAKGGVNYDLLLGRRVEGALFDGTFEIPGTRFLITQFATDAIKEDESGNVVTINAPLWVPTRLSEATIYPSAGAEIINDQIGLKAAAEEIKARISSDNPYFEDFTYSGCSDNLKAYNDRLADLYTGPFAKDPMVEFLDGVIEGTNNQAEFTKTYFANATPGYIIGRLLAKARVRGAALGVEQSFDSSLDSRGNVWEQQITMEIDPGGSILSVLEKLTELGVCDWTSNGRELVLLNPDSGIDHTEDANPIVLAAGRDMLDAPEKRDAGRVATAILVVGKDGLTVERVDLAEEARQGGRVESYLSVSGVDDIGTLSLIGDKALEAAKLSTESLTHELSLFTDGPIPWVDYNVGDWVYRHVADGRGPQRIRVAQLSCTYARDGMVTGAVTLGTIYQSTAQRLQAQIDALTNGSDGIATGQAENPAEDTIAPLAPTGLIVNSDAYMVEGGGTLAAMQADWLPVIENEDGSLIKDFKNYEVIYQVVGTDFWVTAGTPSDNELRWSPLPPLTTIDVKVRAGDRFGNWSPFSETVRHLTATDDTAPQAPSTPVIEPYLGTLRVDWDGYAAGGLNVPMDADLLGANVEYTQDLDGDWILVDRISPGGGRAVISGLNYGEVYYVRLVGEDFSHNLSDPSATASGIPEQIVTIDIGPDAISEQQIIDLSVSTAKIADLAVNDAKIADLSVGKLTAGIMVADVTVAGSFNTSADVNNRVRMDSTGIRMTTGGDQRVLIEPDGTALFTGEMRTANSGLRLVWNAGQTRASIQFHSNATTVNTAPSLYVAANTVNADRPAIIMDGPTYGRTFDGAELVTGLLLGDDYGFFSVRTKAANDPRTFEGFYMSSAGPIVIRCSGDFGRLNIRNYDDTQWNSIDAYSFIAHDGSSMRYMKQDITPLPGSALEFVENAPVYRWRYNEHGPKGEEDEFRIGPMLDDMPEWIRISETEYNRNDIGFIAYEAVRELAQKVKELERRAN